MIFPPGADWQEDHSSSMSTEALIGVVLAPALAFGVAYHPILARLSLALVSPYAKADVVKRASAATIDGVLVAFTIVLYRHSDMPFFLFLGGTYLLLRDSMSGRSIGKFCCGLVVVNLMTGRPCGRGASISRNALFLLPGANIVAAFLEMATIVRDPQGQRLGDRFALTQVVEGFGAKDLAKAVQQWWFDFLARAESHVQGRRGLKTPPYSSRSDAARQGGLGQGTGVTRRARDHGRTGEKQSGFPPVLLISC
jgi:hypothetical protein